MPVCILSNPVTPDVPVQQPAARMAIDSALYRTEGVAVLRPDADQVFVSGMAYRCASAAKLSAALLPLARKAGCEIGYPDGTSGADGFDLVLLASPTAPAGLNVPDEIFGASEEDSGFHRAIFELSAIECPVALIVDRSAVGVIQSVLTPSGHGRASLVVEAAKEGMEAAGPDHSNPDALAKLATAIAGRVASGCAVERVGPWQPSVVRRVERRCSDKFVAIGSAAASVHHSTGLQMRHDLEEAESLATAIVRSVRDGIPLADALTTWEQAASSRSASYQRAAADSAQWLRGADRQLKLSAEQFAFACVTRSYRMGYKRVREAATDFVQELDKQVIGASAASANNPPPPMFAPYSMRGLDLPNRMVFSPMCMYSATDGTVDDFHTAHLGARAVGGFGLVIAEMTNVTAQGRMTPGCAGMYAQDHVAAWRRVTDHVHRHTQARIGIQLAHAGRKGSIGRSWEKFEPTNADEMWEVIAPSPTPFTPDRPVPREMSRADIRETTEAFAKAARMAVEAGFDMIELHMAHGYLLSEFISPLANIRGDSYGGTLENRMRFPLEVYEAMRAQIPQAMPIAARISATDFDPAGVTPRDAIAISRILHEAGCDMIAVSTGGVTSARRPTQAQRLYQLSLCEAIRHEAKTPAMTVGGIVSHTDCNMIIASGRADLCVMARGAMNDPYFPHHAANEQGYRFDWPLPYARADETIIRNS